MPDPTAQPRPRAFAAAIALAFATLALSGCPSNTANRTGLLEPWRIDIPQGNYVTRDALDRVQPGMNPEQVRFLLGSPLLGHVFHDDRWDYVFRYQRPDGKAESRKVTVFFRDGRVERVQADEGLPARDDATDPLLPGYRPPLQGRTNR